MKDNGWKADRMTCMRGKAVHAYQKVQRDERFQETGHVRRNYLNRECVDFCGEIMAEPICLGWRSVYLQPEILRIQPSDQFTPLRYRPLLAGIRSPGMNADCGRLALSRLRSARHRPTYSRLGRSVARMIQSTRNIQPPEQDLLPSCRPATRIDQRSLYVSGKDGCLATPGISLLWRPPYGQSCFLADRPSG